MTYREEADALDAEILRCIESRRVPDFKDLALRIFAHQLRYNAPYAAYCRSLGVTPANLPNSWTDIPAVPAAAFKEAALCTFDCASAALRFQTSGTTAAVSGTHYMETGVLYDAALLAGFRDAMLTDAPVLRYLLIVPNSQERPQSSLGYMMEKVARTFGDGAHRWFLEGDVLHVERFLAELRRAQAERTPVCLAGTAFALVQLLDDLADLPPSQLALPEGSRIMETGGFKGRTRFVERAELYCALSRLFAIPEERIIAEYGMTELTSQYYDEPSLSRTGVRVKHGPAWLRTRIVGPEGRELPAGTVGALVHVDLANRSSCVAIQTEDLGVAQPGGGFVLIGRERGAQLRGCSLDAEQLRTAVGR